MRHRPSTDEREDHDNRHAIVRFCAELADSSTFNFFIFGVILVAMMLLRPEGIIPNRQRAEELHDADTGDTMAGASRG